MSVPLEDRIDRLERANRRLVAAIVALGSAAVVVFGLGAMRGRPEAIEARAITLRDEDGTVRGRWEVGDRGPTIALFGADGARRFQLQVADDGSSTLGLASAPGDHGVRRSVNLRLGTDGWSTLSFADGKGKERLAFGLGYDGEPRLRMYTRDGNSRITLGSDMSGRVDCILHDAGGSERAVLRVAPGGSPSVNLYDADGTQVFGAP